MKRLILNTTQSPGDVVILTATVRDSEPVMAFAVRGHAGPKARRQASPGQRRTAI